MALVGGQQSDTYTDYPNHVLAAIILLILGSNPLYKVTKIDKNRTKYEEIYQ